MLMDKIKKTDPAAERDRLKGNKLRAWIIWSANETPDARKSADYPQGKSKVIHRTDSTAV
jgi:hypothetical protein